LKGCSAEAPAFVVKMARKFYSLFQVKSQFQYPKQQCMDLFRGVSSTSEHSFFKEGIRALSWGVAAGVWHLQGTAHICVEWVGICERISEMAGLRIGAFLLTCANDRLFAAHAGLLLSDFWGPK